jgi:FPC/CPF motif-containing protein YcgG
MRFSEEMYHGDTFESIYYLTVDKFTLKDKAPPSDRFANDTSKLNWNDFSLDNTNDFVVNRITEQTQKAYTFQFLYSQQDYVFENVILFTAIREKCGASDTMKFYFPIKISSFVTSLNLRPVYFKPGVFDITNALTYFIKDNNYIIITLKDYVRFEDYRK